MERRTSVLLAIQITSKADKEFSSLSLPFQSELGFRDEAVNDVRILLKHSFRATDLLARYPRVFTASI